MTMLPKIYKLSELRQINPEIILRPCIICGGDPVVMDGEGESMVKCQKCGQSVSMAERIVNDANCRAYRQWNALNSPPNEEFVPLQDAHEIPSRNCCANCRLNNKCYRCRGMDASQMYSSICQDHLF